MELLYYLLMCVWCHLISRILCIVMYIYIIIMCPHIIKMTEKDFIITARIDNYQSQRGCDVDV